MKPKSTELFESLRTLGLRHRSRNLKVSNLSRVACDQRIISLGRDDRMAGETKKSHTYWPAETFGLQRSGLYQSLSDSQKARVLETMSQLRLSLAWYIEKVGLAYCSRALLECDSHEEKRLYALMASDEAVHQRMVEHFLVDGEPIEALEKHPLLLCIADVIQNAKPMAAVYVVQILLEGFGMSYYSAMRSTCESSLLRGVFDQILKDESRHHGGGLARFGSKDLDAEDLREIEHHTGRLIRAMSGVGFTGIAIETVLNRPLTPEEKEKLLEETEWNRQAPVRLAQIRELLSRHEVPGLNLARSV
ncbi:MAG: hypothetical protein JNL01_01530 [Bdellovibrionales bacterium]|nr:hypothetical protein [Bdellovibrionales bacterium]